MSSFRLGVRARWLVPLIALVASCASSARSASATPHGPTVRLVHGSDGERDTERQLARLLARYDLSPWTHTGQVAIDDDAIPRSAPVLTLSTRHRKDDLLLLSTYIHEQSHWYFDAHAAATAATVTALEARFPGLPVGFPDGANDHESTYDHLCVIVFEYRGLRQLVGELQARQVLEFWATDHYRVLYRTVLEHQREILAIMRAHGLSPPA